MTIEKRRKQKKLRVFFKSVYVRELGIESSE